MTFAYQDHIARLRTCILIESERVAGLKVRTKKGHPINAATLDEAISAAENLLGVRIMADSNSPFGSTKFFRLKNIGTSDGIWLGIMIFRDDIKLYPVNELRMPLMETDVVGISALAGGEQKGDGHRPPLQLTADSCSRGMAPLEPGQLVVRATQRIAPRFRRWASAGYLSCIVARSATATN